MRRTESECPKKIEATQVVFLYNPLNSTKFLLMLLILTGILIFFPSSRKICKSSTVINRFYSYRKGSHYISGGEGGESYLLNMCMGGEGYA